MTPSSSTSPPPPTPSSSGDDAHEPAHELDLRGEICPYTFVRTRLALEALPLGATLRVVVDHPPARRNVPRSAAEWGQEVVSVEDTPTGESVIVLCKRVC